MPDTRHSEALAAPDHYAKLGVASRTEAAVYALHQGWVRREG
jgi:hypothetical protein